MWQQATPGIYTWDQANTYCDDLTLGGYSDWRLPTIKELSTLIDSSHPHPGPAIDTMFFPDTESSWYFSSTTFVGNSIQAWIDGFNSGIVNYGNKSTKYFLRAVRGNKSNNSFIDNGNGTISDTSTGLMWHKATAPGIYTWKQALSYCESLILAGQDDWRLPNKNELQSIVDYSRYNPQ